MTPLVSKVRGDVSPKKSLAFTATKCEYLRRFWVFRKVIPRNEPLGAPVSRWPEPREKDLALPKASRPLDSRRK